MVRCICIALAFLLSACVQDPSELNDLRNLNGNEYADRVLLLREVDLEYPRAGYTYATSSYFYGVQVEYFSPDGNSYLWFRGNSRSIPGEWRIDGSGRELCFRYGPDTRDAVLGTLGGQWECGSRRGAVRSVISFVEGDPFHLSKGTLPAMVLKRCQLPPPMKQMVYRMDCL